MVCQVHRSHPAAAESAERCDRDRLSSARRRVVAGPAPIDDVRMAATKAVRQDEDHPRVLSQGGLAARIPLPPRALWRHRCRSCRAIATHPSPPRRVSLDTGSTAFHAHPPAPRRWPAMADAASWVRGLAETWSAGRRPSSKSPPGSRTCASSTASDIPRAPHPNRERHPHLAARP